MLGLGLREARFCMTCMSFALEASILKPPINQIEVLTTVVDLLVVNPSRFPFLDYSDVLLRLYRTPPSDSAK